MKDEAKHVRCKRCGQHFDCQVHAIQICQCQAVKLELATLAFLEKTTWGCLCTVCLQDINKRIGMIQGLSFPNPDDLLENVHYYIDREFWVFTEYYHLLRGHCCRSGCRHCAYGYKK